MRPTTTTSWRIIVANPIIDDGGRSGRRGRRPRDHRRGGTAAAAVSEPAALLALAFGLLALVSRPVDAAPVAERIFAASPTDGASSATSLTTVALPSEIEGQQQQQQQHQEDTDEEIPVFEQTSPSVNAFEGQTVYLPCRVHGLGDKVVSWMRSRDLHILTSGEFTFSSDERYKLQHLRGSDAWTLQLERVRRTDAGRYECQVNTEPKMMYAVQLVVRDPNKPDGYDEPHSQQTRISYESTAPVAAIMGPREQRVPAGTTITLKCVITSPYQTRPIKGVQWFRDNRLLIFQAARGGINVETVASTAQTLSEATLANLTSSDTGQYSCRPAEGKIDTIALYVEDGDQHTEAMQRDAAFATSLAAASSAATVSIVSADLLPWLAMIIAGALCRRNFRDLSVFC